MRRVVVVGAGLGGLSAACHLAGAGYDVTVVERGAVPGGRAGTLELDRYRFDTGPTVLTMPELFERCFRAVDVEMSELLTVRAIDPIYRACFADGTQINVRRGREAMAQEIREVGGASEEQSFHRFAAWLTELYAREMEPFIARNYDSPLDLVRPLSPALAILRHGAFRRLGPTVARYFSDDRLQRLFSFQALYAGLAPHRALALYAVITYMDTIGGVVVTDGGVQALPRALAEAARRGGAEIRYGSDVERIVTAAHDGGPVTGVRLTDGDFVPGDFVVCNADMPDAYARLLPHLVPPRPVRRGRYSPSAVVWHVGARGALPDGAAHHNIHFGRTWKSAFRTLLDDGRRMRDPSLLVSAPSIDDPTLSPPGAHSLYVLEPVPNLSSGIDWSKERPRVRDDLREALVRFGYPSEIDVEALVDPTDWQRQGLAKGTPFSLAHTFLQTGPFRPSNVERRAPGLVFVGSCTVPGVGVPMVVVSGELAARRVIAMEHA
ncbi:MAG TPA: phytoene desaturase family protein [Ilumatobacter sp.]